MGKIVYYVATSLDSYIADTDGGVDWLFHDADYGYAEFYAGVEAIVMGRRTYDQVVGFGDWPWQGKPAYVFTANPAAEPPADVEFVQANAVDFVRTTVADYPGAVWLVGGGGLAGQFHRAGLIDEYVMSVHPILLGAGIPFLGAGGSPTHLQLKAVRSFDSGLVQLHYLRVGR